MATTRIAISGYLVGNIWWPVGAECWKTFTYDLTREEALFSSPGTLRDHILRITSDGDFQSASIAQGELTITVTKPGRKRSRSFPLSRFPSIADCLHPDPDWSPCFEEDEAA